MKEKLLQESCPLNCDVFTNNLHKFDILFSMSLCFTFIIISAFSLEGLMLTYLSISTLAVESILQNNTGILTTSTVITFIAANESVATSWIEHLIGFTVNIFLLLVMFSFWLPIDKWGS